MVWWGPGSSYLAGNRVYNGGTNNATSGTVNPTGYIDRELKKQSNRRSGLAATALKSLKQKTPAAKPVAPVPPRPKNPVVTATSTGRLVLSEDPNSQDNVLPFDPQTAAQQLLLAKQQQDFLNGLQQQRQQLASGITVQERDLQSALPGQLRGVLNDYASRGMTNSSGYGFDYGQTQANNAQQMADLERQLQEGMAGYDAQQQQQANDYQLALSQLNYGSAEDQSQNAGNLGLAPIQQTPIQQTAAKIVQNKTTTKKPTKATQTAKKIVKKKAGKK